MPKAKLTFPVDQDKKLIVAAHVAGVTLSESILLGDQIHITVSYKDPQSLVKLGGLVDKVTGDELDEPKKKTRKK